MTDDDLTIPDFLRRSDNRVVVRDHPTTRPQITSSPTHDWSIPQSLTQEEREEILARRRGKDDERRAKQREALERMKAEHKANGEVYIPPQKDKNGVVLRRGYWKAKMP